MNDYDNDADLIQKKVTYFFNENIPIHLFYKTGEWARGQIVSIEGDKFILDERIDGRIPVFFIEVAHVEKLKVKR